MYFKCDKINPNHGGSYIDSPVSVQNKNATINPVNKKYNKCFQYDVTVVLNYEGMGKNPEKIIRIKLFINKYKWKGINFPAEKDDWKKIEKNNVRITFNFLYAKEEKIYPADVSKNNSNREKQIILLMISNEEK